MENTRESTDEAAVAEELISVMRKTIAPGTHGELWVKLTVFDGQVSHIKSGFEKNRKLRDLRK